MSGAAYRTRAADNALGLPLSAIDGDRLQHLGTLLAGAGTHTPHAAAATVGLVDDLHHLLQDDTPAAAAQAWLDTLTGPAHRRDRIAAAAVACVASGATLSNRDDLPRPPRTRRPLSDIERGAIRFCAARHHPTRAVIVALTEAGRCPDDIAAIRTANLVIDPADNHVWIDHLTDDRTVVTDIPRWATYAAIDAAATHPNGRLCLTGDTPDPTRDRRAIHAALDRALHTVGVDATPASLRP